MSLPVFVPSIASDIEHTIQSKLTALEADYDVRVLFAIESGSRAWGFPSPDSDYDVRFVYAHQPDWYLSIEPGRDVIELPIEGDWDINGWDIRKALGLLIKPNPVMLEWLSSPIRYRWNDDVCQRLITFSEKTTFGESCLHHYRNLAQKQWDKHVGDNPDVALKKYFYILRPALAIYWIRQNVDVQPPMNLQALVEGLDIAPVLTAEIERLLELKAVAKEVGRGDRIAEVDAFIHEQIEWATVVAKKEERPDLMAEGDHLLRMIVKGEG
ncbi:nucleotidyltransferase domain-containing protein [Cognatiyoonia sp. IB215446]|uniref:nucleotidyltransferase domain-containing protein n=1 Tax=Cognatiyoonia sp. IB215446 TaxID=3097355 RepID=UPI002A114AF2|nr:nucleotidyltransferase domain-containing protein [Cognatiyoonia sp. IB215446]MDX8346525.1 nucleotidyltransferase domain-containing protein [Cognatiyoonia sp. IB215446]